MPEEMKKVIIQIDNIVGKLSVNNTFIGNNVTINKYEHEQEYEKFLNEKPAKEMVLIDTQLLLQEAIAQPVVEPTITLPTLIPAIVHEVISRNETAITPDTIANN